MANPATFISLDVSAHPLGKEIIINWALPATLPSNWTVRVFRKLNGDVTQQVIDDYMADPASLPADIAVQDVQTTAGFNDETIEQQVIRSDPDERPINEARDYYYKAIIVNADTDEYSTAQGGHIVPESDYAEIGIDSKTLLITSIVKILRNHKMVNGVHYDIVRAYGQQSAASAQIVVTRTNIQENIRFWGDTLERVKDEVTKGQLDTELFQVTWEDEYISRIDAWTTLFQKDREVLRRTIRENEAIRAVGITFTGDGADNIFRDKPMPMSGMSVLLITESGIKVSNQERYGAPITMQPTFS